MIESVGKIHMSETTTWYQDIDSIKSVVFGARVIWEMISQTRFISKLRKHFCTIDSLG